MLSIEQQQVLVNIPVTVHAEEYNIIICTLSGAPGEVLYCEYERGDGLMYIFSLWLRHTESVQLLIRHGNEQCMGEFIFYGHHLPNTFRGRIYILYIV